MAVNMHLEPGASGSARQSDQAYDLLKDEIILCRLLPGDDFSEIELSTRYSLARAATRAALIRLTQIGLVQPVPRHGFRISPVTIVSIKELFELRLIVEPQVAAMAVGRVDTVQLRQINRQPQAARSAEEQLEFLDSNRTFHRVIAMATGNMRLVQLLESIADEMTRLIHLGLFSDQSAGQRQNLNRQEADAQHEALIVAFEARDIDAAHRASVAHIEHARQMVLDQIINSRPSISLR
jgi:DNA-binding GntR family transcriptional regulator